MVTLTGVAAMYYAVPVGGTAVLAHPARAVDCLLDHGCLRDGLDLAEGVSATHLTRRLLN